MSAARWTRTDTDGASEILTLVKIDGRDGLCVEICAGPEVGDDFVGLYDLDGDQLSLGNCTWEAVDASEIPAAIVENFASDWESGSSTVTRLP